MVDVVQCNGMLLSFKRGGERGGGGIKEESKQQTNCNCGDLPIGLEVVDSPCWYQEMGVGKHLVDRHIATFTHIHRRSRF